LKFIISSKKKRFCFWF